MLTHPVRVKPTIDSADPKLGLLMEHDPVVYYLTNALAPDSLVKIGRTNCVVRRFRVYAKGHPGFQPLLLTCEWGDYDLESHRHSQFHGSRFQRNAEWFWRTSKLNAWIEELSSQS